MCHSLVYKYLMPFSLSLFFVEDYTMLSLTLIMDTQFAWDSGMWGSEVLATCKQRL